MPFAQPFSVQTCSNLHLTNILSINGKKLMLLSVLHIMMVDFETVMKKLSHIRKVQMSARNGHILNEIIPLTIDQKWLKNKNGDPTLL